MQYLKDYREDLYDILMDLHKIKKSEENCLLNQISQESHILYEIPAEDKSSIIKVAENFLNIENSQFWKNIELCYKKAENLKLIKNQEETDISYYINEFDELWLCLNIDVQLRYYNQVYSFVCERYKDKNISIGDYGCGSASLTFALNKKLNFNKIGLYDIENFVSNFVQYYIDKEKISIAKRYNVLEDNNETYDLITCSDVLEHIEKSSEVLKKIYKKLNKNGCLILRVAFEAESIGHLPQSAENFFIKSDGWEFLNKNFDLIHNFDFDGGLLINGCYQRKE